MGELERRVMDVLWENPEREFTGREVLDVLPEYAYTTIATVLDRLSRKGYVRRRMSGRTIRFTTTDTSAGKAAQGIRQLLSATDDPASALAEFVRTSTEVELQALREALARSGRQPKARRGRASRPAV